MPRPKKPKAATLRDMKIREAVRAASEDGLEKMYELTGTSAMSLEDALAVHEEVGSDLDGRIEAMRCDLKRRDRDAV